MSKNMKITSSLLRLKHIKIENYKGIDCLEIDFAQPKFKDSPDVTVIGSQNGLGKTSILECCALLMTLIEVGGSDIISVPRLFSDSFKENFTVTGQFQIENSSVTISSNYSKKENTFTNQFSSKFFDKINNDYKNRSESFFEQNIASLLGQNPNPIFANQFLFFNSYRKIQESSPELGMLVHKPDKDLLKEKNRTNKFPQELLEIREKIIKKIKRQKQNL
jgi:hypothetical protein